MKESYCKYCGLELEAGKCTCADFNVPEKERASIKMLFRCETCGKMIDGDATYCPYCGIPVYDGKVDKHLKKELEGDFAEDVLEHYYGKKVPIIEKVKSHFTPTSWKITVALSGILAVLVIGLIISPFIRVAVSNYEMSKFLATSIPDETSVEFKETMESIEESAQPVIDLKDGWLRQDGFIYCFNEDGDPVVDEWITIKDEDGNEKKYYFDIDGKLVVNTWIDGEYYVGPDGAMLTNCDTPDGATLDEDGRVILKNVDTVPVERETMVYYESPDQKSETKAASTQKSGNSGTIKGVDSTKTYELYVKNIGQIRDSYSRDDLKCNIIYYYPIMAGSKEKEVTTINEKIVEVFNKDLKAMLIEYVKGFYPLPKSIVLNEVEQRSVNSNRVNILLHGRVTPREGLYTKVKFRMIYDRKSKQIEVANITE